MVKASLAAARIVTAYPVALLAAALGIVADRLGRYVDIALIAAYLPLRWGECVRYHFYRLTLEGVGRGCVFKFGSLCSYRQARLGDNIYLGCYTIVGAITVGNNVLTGPEVLFLSGRHQHGYDDSMRLICEQPGRGERIVVGDDVWVGGRAVVMCNIGTRCVVGAGAVVTHDVEDGTVVAGNPARLLRRIRSVDA